MKVINHIAALSLLAASNFSASAEMNGNIEYSIETIDGSAQLILINKRPETPVSLTHLAAIQVDQGKIKGTEIPITTPKNTSIAPKLVVDLGSVASLSEKMNPNINHHAYKAVILSENNGCETSCDRMAFPLMINLSYAGGTTQSNLISTFIKYILR